MWFVVFFCIDTGNLANLPITGAMQLGSAAEIVADSDNWRNGFYGVIRGENPESYAWLKQMATEHPIETCRPHAEAKAP